MHLNTPLLLATITTAALAGCNATQQSETIPATPLVPLEAGTDDNVVAVVPPEPLAIGDDAPQLSIDHWVKGTAINGFESGQVYVMEFWATWCGPCITSMPHLSGLQDRYGNTVKIIGVSSESELETVTSFLEETNKTDNMLNSDRMRYTVTVDPDRSTSRVYMEASGQRGIPTAFIINGEGKVAWIGHPMNMDEPLEQIVIGTWDLAAAAADFKKEHAQDQAMIELRDVYVEAMQNDDWDAWITAIDAFTAEYGDNPQMSSTKFDALLFGKKDTEAAYMWARTMLAHSWDDAQALNAFAWNLLDRTPKELQDLDFALEVASRANEITESADPAILDTLARAYWELGDVDTAVAWQQKAVAYAEEDFLSNELQATLDAYLGEETPDGDEESIAAIDLEVIVDESPEPVPSDDIEVIATTTPESPETPDSPEIQEDPDATVTLEIAEPELQPLAVGDAAPEISIDHWVKGAAIDNFEIGQVYVMEFWATWCGPCIASMPHLSGLQEQYADTVKIIGVSSESELETVTNFLEETNKSDNLLNNDRMRYTVTVDPDRSTSRAFMEASGQRGIPTAFIINDEGKVAWIGHPMGMDEPLEQVVNGTWDIAAAAAEFEKGQAQDLAMVELRTVYTAAMENEDWDAWIAAIDAFAVQYGENSQLSSMKFDALLTGKKDKVAAYAWARTMLASSWDNAQALNAFAWNLLDRTPEELQDLDYALEVATRASDLTNNEDPMILDTLARAYWELGETYKAIAWQQKAVEYADNSEMGEGIIATLKEYEATLVSVESD